MITEDYVSFEVARLLKEKGFTSEKCYTAYDDNGNFFWYGDYSKDRKNVIDAPTLQMTMKWLREIHKIVISIFPTIETDMIVREDYNYAIYKNKTIVYQSCSTSYEQAIETAIKYCLDMIQEDKELLLKDLCARQPWGVKVQYNNKVYAIDYVSAEYEEVKLDIPDNYTVGISDIKPYLRPMSSMTEEEVTEIDKLNRPPGGDWTVQLTRSKIGLYDDFSRVVSFKSINKVLDYLNAHHFDYRGLIEKGLALEASKDMY